MTGEVLYGVHPVAECLRAGRRSVKKLWVADRARVTELEHLAGRPLPAVETAPRQVLEKMAASPHHQGVVAQVEPYPYEDWRDLLESDGTPLVVALDNLTDPQNVGAILRSALCAGATGVTLRSHHAALVTPAVAKASAGACEHLRVAQVSNQSMFLRAAGEAFFTRVALDMDGESLWEAQVNWQEPVVLVVGAEGRGVSELVGKTCDRRVRIPMAASFDSLNASVAASLALFEAARRRAGK